jgi:uncharacterized protein (DUF2237 family)
MTARTTIRGIPEDTTDGEIFKPTDTGLGYNAPPTQWNRPVDESTNVFGEPLESCSDKPLTGFFRDGCCNTSDADAGSHTVCVQVTAAFLEFSRFRGNDLSTPHPEFQFPGLKPGDRWCLCAARWLEAHENGMAPKVFLRGTHARALEIVPLATLRKFALDLN